MPARDFTGLRSGMLVAIRPAHSTQYRRLWLFRCDCGIRKTMRPDKVFAGLIQSCGCSQHPKGIFSGTPYRDPPNPWAGTRTYRSYHAMIQRCTNPKLDKYAYYGAVGITVCDRWRLSFFNFLADMGERPEGTSIDRWPDPAGNYEPANCRWATPKQQAENKRKWGTVAPKKFRKMKKENLEFF